MPQNLLPNQERITRVVLLHIPTIYMRKPVEMQNLSVGLIMRIVLVPLYPQIQHIQLP